MNQAEKQFRFDLQVFAEDVPESAPEAAPAEETVQSAPEATPPEDSPQEPQKHISEMTDDEQTEYIKKHFLNEGGRPRKEDKPQEPQGQGEAVQPQQEPQAEPTFEIVHNGEKKQVTQSELINLAQQGFDYTQKTQALAQQRRELEQKEAQFQQQRQPQQQVNPAQRAEENYKMAVNAACGRLGIALDDFNQFDPVHAFALQQVVVEANMRMGQQMNERRAVEQEVTSFAQEIKADPMGKEISDHYEEQLLRRLLDPKQGAEAQKAVMAYSRFVNNQATMQDCKVLKEHWAYVKKELTKAKTPPAPPKPVAQPPRTEAPGVGRSSGNGGVMDVRKLRDLSNDPDRQMAYMKSLGIFND